MIVVNAPEGYEGSRCFIDGARAWQTYYRKVGNTWWTTCGYAGQSHLTDSELDKRASALISQHIEIYERTKQ